VRCARTTATERAGGAIVTLVIIKSMTHKGGFTCEDGVVNKTTHTSGYVRIRQDMYMYIWIALSICTCMYVLNSILNLS
jgi:hypothetical protein